MITCPVFARTDKDDPIVGRATSGEDAEEGILDKRAALLGNFPRAIVQVINKHDPLGFIDRDVVLLEYICGILGRCHDCILKVEQIYCMKSVIEKMETVSTKIKNNLTTNLENYDMLKYSFRDFVEKADESDRQKIHREAE